MWTDLIGYDGVEIPVLDQLSCSLSLNVQLTVFTFCRSHLYLHGPCPLNHLAWLSASHPALVSDSLGYRLCSPITLFPPPQVSPHTSFPLPHTYHSPPPLTCSRAFFSCVSLPTIFLELHFPQFCVYRTYTFLYMQVHNYVLHVGYIM